MSGSMTTSSKSVGDSLSATQMICEVEAIIGQKIPQSALGTVFTVRELAARVLHRMPVSEELITCAKPGRGSPFFFCHGDYTTRGVYALRLAKMLTCDQPVYLLHPYIDFNLNHPIEEMAQVYLPGLLAAHPTGVFRLGGHCNGALLAWEIARQLERLGRKVEFMALIEAPSVNARPVFRAAALLNSSIVAVAPRKIGQKFAREGMRARCLGTKGFPAQRSTFACRHQLCPAEVDEPRRLSDFRRVAIKGRFFLEAVDPFSRRCQLPLYCGLSSRLHHKTRWGYSART
jgi:Thioesterase domain